MLATVLGTLVGIARLSRRTGSCARSPAVYVEAVRNIPLLLFVIFGYVVVVLGVFPRIQDAWEPLGLVVISNRGIAVPWFEGAGALALLAIGRGRHRCSRGRSRVGGGRSSTAPAHRPRSGLWALGVLALVVAVGWLAARLLGVTAPGGRRPPVGRRHPRSTRRSSRCSSRS